jgi:hypothetical protein
MNCAMRGALCAAFAFSVLVGRCLAAPPTPITVEYIKQRSEDGFHAGPCMSLTHYTLVATGDIWQRARIMNAESIGDDLRYSGPAPLTRCVYLSVECPEQTTFAAVSTALERIKAAITKNVTGNCTVIIKVFPRDWVFEHDAIDGTQVVQDAKSGASDPGPAAAESSNPGDPNPDAAKAAPVP